MPRQRLYRLFPATIALLTLIAFLPALRNDFVNWDDETNFLLNEAFRGLGLDQIHWMWTSHLNGRYIPLSWMTLGLDYSIWGMEPLGYHLTNILWHAANAVVFYFLALALFRWAIPESAAERRDRIPLGALFAAMLFAVHPLRAESVAWITERRDVVSGFFYLLTILIYVRGVQDSPARPLQRKYYWACFALFILGILSKEMVVTLPAILLILDVYPLGRLPAAPSRWFTPEVRSVWLEKIPFFAVSIADSALALYVGHQEKISASMAALSPFRRFAISIYGLAFYLWKSILPVHLSAFYALTPYRVDPRGLPFQLSVVLVAWMIAAAVLFRRRYPALTAAFLAYGFTLIPVLGIFHNGRQITADRYTYLPCLGLALLAGACVLGFQKRGGTLAVATAALIVCALGFLTWRQVQVWHDSETLWTHAIAVEPSYMAFNNLGLALSASGDTAGAIDKYRTSIQIHPEFEISHTNLGASLLELQEWDEAANEFQIALNLSPGLVNAHAGLGFALMKQGNLDQAIDQFQIALRIDPDYKPARTNLDRAQILKRSGTK
ncbi:MAG TPA: tetratricopeptide repeat protein [Bryobacteraceae bacterium]|nr:tetratricopeptide repeat protein [Bryobacteraceae bacterium]